MFLNTNTQVPLTVSQLSNQIKITVESTFQQVEVQGEISGFKRHSSGHSYFALKDSESVLDCVMWRGTPLNIQPCDGMEVVAQGKITTYGGRSKYQMVVKSLTHAGEGALLKLLEERKKAFLAEGLFQNQRPLPKFPSVIGVITSETGAVIQDILHRLRERFPCTVKLVPVAVQGEAAAAQIAKAIYILQDASHKIDVIIVARGGGSLEDLWAFNEEVVVRAVAASAIPVVSAVGHETDTTLIDYAADLRAPTPTAAAELCTPDRVQILSLLNQQENILLQGNQRLFERHRLLLGNLIQRMPDLPAIVYDKSQRLDERSSRLQRIIEHQLNMKNHKVIAQKLLPPRQQLRQCSANFLTLQSALSRSIAQYLKKQQDAVKWSAMMLSQNSYQRSLDRGFSLVRVAGKPIKTAAALQMADIADIQLSDGKVTVRPVDKQ